MANPNPYKKINIEEYALIKQAIDDNDKEQLIKHFQYWIHTKQKFEKAYQREYNRRKKLEEFGGNHKWVKGCQK